MRMTRVPAGSSMTSMPTALKCMTWLPKRRGESRSWPSAASLGRSRRRD